MIAKSSEPAQQSAVSPWQIARPVVRAIDVYAWEDSTAALAARYGLAPEQVLRFDMNTSPYAPIDLDGMLEQVARERLVNEYFDASYADLSQALAAYTGLTPAHVLIGAGADEVLDIVAKTFLNNGDRAVTLYPSYAMYPILTEQMGAVVVRVPYGPPPTFAITAEAIVQAAQQSAARIIFLCSPNNPTGNSIPLPMLKQILQQAPCMVVIDEAYSEFSGQTCASLVDQHPHLIVVRTFSKAFAMAGARVGYALAAPATVELLTRVRPPNSVSYASATLAARTLAHVGRMRVAVGSLLNQRETLRQALQQQRSDLWVSPSDTNFLLVRWADATAAAATHTHLLAQGLVLRRYPNHPVLAAYLRLTVRTASQNARLLAALTH